MSITTSLGKRKRPSSKATKLGSRADSSDASDQEDAAALFRRAFEAKFAPLERVERAAVEEEDRDVVSEGGSDESDWSGLSEDDRQVEVVQHELDVREDAVMGKEKRAYMSSKPPTAVARKTSLSKKLPRSDDAEAGVEAINLKHDVALQRLLKESHLLESSGDNHRLEGRNRIRATELRLQALGAKTSMLEQKNMPMSHRRGIKAKTDRTEAQRRQEAKENGIVLERAVPKKPAQSTRVRGIGGPSVGKFQGGMLKLSKKDVSSITGPKRTGQLKRKGKRR